MNVDELDRLIEHIGPVGRAVLTLLKEGTRPLTFQEMKNHPYMSKYCENELKNSLKQLYYYRLIGTKGQAHGGE